MNTDLAKALLAVQGKAPALQRDGINPHFKSSYVTLESLMESVLPILNENGIVLVQAPSVNGLEDVLVTKLVHAESGETTETITRLYMSKDDAQGYGSAVTYARRYALMAMLGLVADADDDGAAASKSSTETKKLTSGKERAFDPSIDLAPSAMRVRTGDDAVALQQAVRDLDPDQDWNGIYGYLQRELFGEPYNNDMDNAQKREWWTRLANAVARVNELAGPGDFPPPTVEQIKQGFAWAFNGTVLALSDDLTPFEAEADVAPSPEEEAAQAAPEEQE